MTSTLPPYPAYKPSGIQWLGDIPAHWQVRRLKQLCTGSALYGANVAAVHYQDSGVRFLRTSDINDDGNLEDSKVYVPSSLVADYILNDGDILLSRSGTIGRSFLYQSDIHGVCSYAGYLVRFVPNSEVLPKYVFLFTKTRAFKHFLHVMSISSTIENLNGDKYANLYLPLPPLAEQAAIARYLDRADERIRRAISAKERLIELLTEQRQAVIQRAVTRGLNDHAPLRSSGVDWLGDIPAHWQVRRLKQLCTGSALYGANVAAVHYQDSGVRFLRTSDINDDGYLEDSKVYVPSSLVADYILNDGDILLSRSGTIGRSFLYQSDIHGVCSYAGYLVRFVPNSEVLPKYVFLFTKTRAFKHFLHVMSISSTIENLNGDKYANLYLPLPPLAEQAAIARYLDRATADIDDAIAGARRQAELLREYRARLIADAVCGRIDTRGAA